MRLTTVRASSNAVVGTRTLTPYAVAPWKPGPKMPTASLAPPTAGIYAASSGSTARPASKREAYAARTLRPLSLIVSPC